MAETQQKPVTVPSTTAKREESEEKSAKAADLDKLKEDPRFDLPTTTVTTSEDAYQAYLREEITEEELRAVVAANGGSPFYALKGNLERPDNAFQRTVPEDMYDDPSLAVSTVEDRLKVAEDKEKAAEAAREAAEKLKTEKDIDPSTHGEVLNAASREAAEKASEK